MPKTQKRTSGPKRASPYGSASQAGTKTRKMPSPPNKKPAKSSTKAINAAAKEKTAARPQHENYLFSCQMVLSSDPTITRFLSVPACFTFEMMHAVMQVAFGWAGIHMWNFEVMKLHDSDRARREYENERGLRGIMQFLTDPEDMESSMPDCADDFKSASEWKLSDIFGNDEYRGKVESRYEYDHGDSWEHLINFMGVEDPGFRKTLMSIPQYDIPLCFGGEGHPCAEDCGSAEGWEGLKELFAERNMRDDDGVRQWYKKDCANGDPKGLDPYRWDILIVNDDLQMIKPKV